MQLKKILVHIISLANRLISTKLIQIHYYDEGKKWFDFGDRDLIVNVTTL